jgi:hypothetical protein
VGWQALTSSLQAVQLCIEGSLPAINFVDFKCFTLARLQMKKGAGASQGAEAPRIDYTKSAAVFAKIQEQRDSAAAAAGGGGGKPAGVGVGGVAAAAPAVRYKL